jgi:hypothetical protein
VFGRFAYGFRTKLHFADATVGSWPIGSVQAVAQLQIIHCNNGNRLLDDDLRICIGGGYFLCTLEGGWTADYLLFLVKALGLLLVLL